MAAIAIALVCVTFALLAFAAWRGDCIATSRARTIEELSSQQAFVVEAMRALIAASRTSGEAVLAELYRLLRARCPQVDAILVFAPDGEELRCIHAEGERVEYFRHARCRRDDRAALPARAATARHRVTLDASATVVMPTDRSAFAVPLENGDALQAIVYASSMKPGALDCADPLVQLIRFAELPYAIATEREADRADATLDGLTGLLTPRALRRRLHDAIATSRYQEHAPTLSIWFIDTDRFKIVNDRYGHAAGDGVLQAMANLLARHAVAGVDVVARNGGDEFCALIGEAQKAAAIERAQAFCDAVREHDFGVPVEITASIGVASFPLDARSSSELLEVADAAMYHSKRSGRDRVSYALGGSGFATYR